VESRRKAEARVSPQRERSSKGREVGDFTGENGAFNHQFMVIYMILYGFIGVI
jgi:hypothetical protein